MRLALGSKGGYQPVMRAGLGAGEQLVVALLVGIAVLLRVGMVSSLDGTPFLVDPILDGEVYDRWAREIAFERSPGGATFFTDPLYAYFLAGLYRMFGRDLYLVRLVQVGVGVAGCLALFSAARRLLGVRAALVALALAATYRPFVFFDTALLKDFLGVALIEVSLWRLAVSLDTERRAAWSVTGIAFGLLVLARGNALLLVAGVALGLVARKRRAGGATLAAFLVGAGLVLLPVTLRNASVGGALVLPTSNLGSNLYIGNNPENTTGRYLPPSFVTAGSPRFEERDFRREAERRVGRPLGAGEVDSFWRREALRFIARNPATFLTTTAKRAALLVNRREIPDDYDLDFLARFSRVLRLPLPTFALVGVLGFLGLALSVRERPRFFWYHLLLASYLVSIVFFFVFARFRLPLMPLLMLFAAYAITETCASIRSRDRRAVARSALLGVGAAGLVHLPVEKLLDVGSFDFITNSHLNLATQYIRRDRCDLAIVELRAAMTRSETVARDQGVRFHFYRCLLGKPDRPE